MAELQPPGPLADTYQLYIDGRGVEPQDGRYDDIDVGLLKTRERVTLSTVRQDRVQEGSTGLYVQNALRWTNWLRTIAGIREDYVELVDAAIVVCEPDANKGLPYRDVLARTRPAGT